MSARERLEVGKVAAGRYLVEGWDVRNHGRAAAPALRWQARNASHPGAVIRRRTLTEVCEALYAVGEGTFRPWSLDEYPDPPD